MLFKQKNRCEILVSIKMKILLDFNILKSL
jgi:hypothetical protein